MRMDVLVFGASGRTGRLVVKESLEKGHHVLAFVRNPSRLDLSHPQLETIQGDAKYEEDVDRAVQRGQSVVSVLGQAAGSPLDICSVGTANIVDSMKKHGVRRLICLSDYGNGETRNKGPYSRFLWLVIRAHLEDKEKMENTVRSSGLAWTIVRATILTDGPRTASYKAGPEIKVGLVPKISRNDVADLMVRQLTDDTSIGLALSISH
jgi:uncharacterized protein YbjT (DUF2867 family)